MPIVHRDMGALESAHLMALPGDDGTNGAVIMYQRVPTSAA